MKSPAFPYNSTTTWNLRTLGRCDESAMQLMYDLANKAGPYANCYDHITSHGVDGLVTDLTATPSSTTVCANTTVTISGRLQVHDYASYQTLGANGLWSRTVWIDRGTAAKYTSTTTNTSSTNNWSKTFTGSNITYSFSAHYDRTTGEGLDSSPDRVFTITWLSPQVGC